MEWNFRNIVSARTEHVVLWVLFISLVVLYLIWATRIIQAFCKFLGINCLTIRRQTQSIPRSSEGKKKKTMDSQIEQLLMLPYIDHVESDSLLDHQEDGQASAFSPETPKPSTYNTFK